MANNQLILGAGKAAKKFLDVGAEMRKGLGKGFLPGASLGPSKTALKNKEYESRVNSLMGKMKTDMDFTSFSAKETSSMRNFLVAERGKYASAAKELAGMTDTTSSEYMAQVDIMNGVNNSFKNLAAQLKSYKEGKATFAKDMLDGTISRGNPTQNTKESMVMYGFIDEDGDGVNDKPTDSPFSIQAGGNIGFDIDGRMVDYNTRKQAVMKDYVLSNKLLTGNESAYKAKARMSPTSQKLYRQQLEEDFESRDALMSMVYDFDSIVTTQDLATRWDESENSLDEINSIKKDLIDRLVEARVEVSNKGYNENQAEKTPKNANPVVDIGPSRNGKFYLIRKNGDETEVTEAQHKAFAAQLIASI